MKKVLLFGLVLLAACGGKTDNKAADTTAAAAAPPALTVADLTGTLSGTTMAEATDSVIGTWTSQVTAGASGGAEGRFTSSLAPKDTVPFTQTIQGDSVISESANYNEPMAPKGAGPMHWRAVGHRTGGNEWAGTVVIMPAGKDSVAMRFRWKATHTP